MCIVFFNYIYTSSWISTVLRRVHLLCQCYTNETIFLHESSSSALKVTFEVCPEMRKHMEILPKTGVIQAHSSFNAHLKFLPR